MTRIQRLLKRRRQEHEIVVHGGTSYFCWITKYDDSMWLVRVTGGITRWFSTREIAIQWWLDYVRNIY